MSKKTSENDRVDAIIKRNLWVCEKCGSKTNTYRHPHAKVWCPSCGNVLREEGDQRIVHDRDIN